MIKGIIFDMGGVLLPDDRDAMLKTFSKRKKIDFDTLKRMLDEDHENLVTGKLSVKEFLTRIRNRFALEEDSLTLELEWNRVYVESTPINFELLEEVKKLRKKYVLAIVANIYDTNARINQNRKLFYPFKTVLLSCRAGIAKPDVKILAKAVHQMQLKGDECVFIDDKEKNLGTAKEFGMKTILYKDNKQLMKDLKKLGVKPDKK